MRWLAVGLIWLGYAIAVAAVAFGTKDAGVTMVVGLSGASFAAVSTFLVTEAKP